MRRFVLPAVVSVVLAGLVVGAGPHLAAGAATPPTLTYSAPDGIYPGAQVALSASGLTPGTTYVLSDNGARGTFSPPSFQVQTTNSAPVSTYTVSESGGIQALITVSVAGSSQPVAKVLVDDDDFPIVSATAAFAGGTTTISGGDFLLNERVDITFAGGTLPPVIATADDGQGRSITFTTSVTIPSTIASQVIPFTAVGETSGATARSKLYVLTDRVDAGTSLVTGTGRWTIMSRSMDYALVSDAVSGEIRVDRVNAGGRGPIWIAPNSGPAHDRLVLQGDGNLVVYSAAGRALWASNTAGTGAHNYLQLHDDGDLVLYNASGVQLWHSGPDLHDTLPTGARLTSGHVLGTASESDCRTIMRGDGDLVSGSGPTAWHSGTAGHPGAEAVMQGDGNLVIYWHGRALWASHTRGTGSANRATIWYDCGLVVTTQTGTPVWASSAGRIWAHGLPAGSTLPAGWKLTNPGGTRKLAMQTDGNLVVYGWGFRRPDAEVPTYGAQWATNIFAPHTRLIMQGDGNLVIYSGSRAIWATGTFVPGSRLVMQDDGNVVIYSPTGKAVWATMTLLPH